MSVVFFTDRDLGHQFPAILRAGGLQVERHTDHFPPGCPDEIWLAEVSTRSWVAVTHDARIRYKPNELAAVVEHNVALLVVVGHAKFADLARSFVATAPKIYAFLEQHEPPFIAKVLRPSSSDLEKDAQTPGHVELWYPKVVARQAGPADFDIHALYAALDEQRRARGLGWQQVAREISRRFEGIPARGISSSTLSGMRTHSAIEGDGVLQMLLWLRRTPESFVPGGGQGTPLPDPGPNRILRFDSRAIHAALDAQRIERKLTWKQVSAEIGGGIAPASLTRLSQGGRVAFPQVMRIVRWLGRPAARFTR